MSFSLSKYSRKTAFWTLDLKGFTRVLEKYWFGQKVWVFGGVVVKNLPANVGNIRDVGSIPGLGRSPGGGHGNAHQYSCLESPMDRGAWQAAVHGVAKSRTRLKWLSMRAPTCYVRVSCRKTQTNFWANPIIVFLQSLSCGWLFATPMDCSLPGFPVLHYLLEFALIRVHWGGDATWSSHPLPLGGGNGKSLWYSCRENPVRGMKRPTQYLAVKIWNWKRPQKSPNLSLFFCGGRSWGL